MIAYLTITTITFLYVNLVLAIKFYTIVNPPFKTKMYDYIHIDIVDNKKHEFSYYLKKIKIATYVIDLDNNTVIDRASRIKLDGFYPMDILKDYQEYKKDEYIKYLIETSD